MSSVLSAKKLTTKQAAEMLGVTEGTLRYWRHDGTGPTPIKIGSAVRYTEEALLDFLRKSNPDLEL